MPDESLDSTDCPDPVSVGLGASLLAICVPLIILFSSASPDTYSNVPGRFSASSQIALDVCISGSHYLIASARRRGLSLQRPRPAPPQTVLACWSPISVKDDRYY